MRLSIQPYTEAHNGIKLPYISHLTTQKSLKVKGRCHGDSVHRRVPGACTQFYSTSILSCPTKVRGPGVSPSIKATIGE